MVQPFSLLSEPWIPVLRADGARDMVRPAAITSEVTTNPVIAPAWGRADFDAATREFWIGLLATACGRQADDDGDGWEEWFRSPPTPEVLDAAFAPLASAFMLDGDGPRFGQDLNDFAGESVNVSQLLIEAPGANTVKRNLDHFVHRGGVETLSRAGVAIALFTLQTYAPSGGAGHRVSVRGGGPLTTLLVPGDLRGDSRELPSPLWRTLWLATPHRNPAAPASIFPWLEPTRVSDKGKTTTDSDVDKLQAFWGMPRRIRLLFEPNLDCSRCDLTGRLDDTIVRTYRTRPHGTSYVAFQHPLSPHYRAEPTDPFLPLHGQPGRIGYRHWVGLVVNDILATTTPPLRQVAEAIETGRRRLDHLESGARAGARLLAAGYDMDNMKAREFIESEMPLPLVERVRFASYDRIVRRLVAGAREAEGIARLFVRQALFVKRTQMQDGFTKAPKGGGALDLARARFWERTEAGFGQALVKLSDDLSIDGADPEMVGQAAAQSRLVTLRDTAFAIFDELVSLEDLDALDERSARARIEARNDLHGALRGFGKLGQSLFGALDLATPDVVKKRKAVA